MSWVSKQVGLTLKYRPCCFTGEDAAREGATAGPGDGCPLPESDGHAPCPDPAMWWLLPPSCTYLVSF